METPRPPLLQLHLRLHPHPQIHGPHWSRPHPLPGARQRGPPRGSRGPLPVPSSDAPPGPRNRAGLPGLRTLPPPLPPGGLRGRHQTHSRAHPTRTPCPGPRANGHPTGQRLTGRDRLLPLPQQPHRPPHKVSGHDQGVCHTSHPRATRAPHASRDNHHPPGGNPGRQP